MLNLSQKKALLQELPEKLQEAIDSIENIDKVEAIGKESHLLLDQIAELDNVITETILGVVKTEDFTKEVRQRVGVDFEVAEQLKNRIDEEIFRPIKEYLVSRPSSSKKEVESVEEDESKISRESLLQEIESPSPSKFTRAATPLSILEVHSDKVLGSVKTEALKSPQIPTEILPSLPPIIDPSHEIEAPHTAASSPEKPQMPPVVSPSVPTPAPSETPKPIPLAPPIIQAPRTVTEIKPAQPAKAVQNGSPDASVTEAFREKRRTIDPYREPIE